VKAIVYREYGGPERLALEEVTRPSPGAQEVLVQVAAVALNASDTEFLAGCPLYARIRGLSRPRRQVLGSDLAGRVVAVGDRVTRFRAGDAVMCDVLEHGGGLAEFALAPEDRLVAKPEGLSFEEAAAVPQSGVLALEALLYGGGPAGEKLLINGAGGGAGTFALQLARHLGAAKVTAVDRPQKHALMRSLGADEVIDHTAVDFARCARRYDRIIDLVASRSTLACARALERGGVYLLVGGSVRRLLEFLSLGPLVSIAGARRLRVLAYRKDRGELEQVAQLCASGAIRPIIQRSYPLRDAAEAFRELRAGCVSGKVVVTL